jgi:hypothetical protein
LLARCLDRDPRRRLLDIGDARIEIEDALSGPAPGSGAVPSDRAPASSWRRALPWAVAAASLALALAVVVTDDGTPPVSTGAFRTSIQRPAGTTWAGTPAMRFALSPDGRRLAFLATDLGGLTTRVWIHSLESGIAQALAGTELASAVGWSPDSRSLAFVDAGRLRRIDLSGGPAATLAEEAIGTSIVWMPDDTLLFGRQQRGPLYRVSAAGGTPSPATTLDAASGEVAHQNPSLLPDGRHFLYLALSEGADGALEGRAVYVGSLDPDEGRRLLLESATNAHYAAGYLFFMRGTTLMAQRFDEARLGLTGDPEPLAEDLQVGGATGRTAPFRCRSRDCLLITPARPGSCRSSCGSIVPASASVCSGSVPTMTDSSYRQTGPGWHSPSSIRLDAHSATSGSST